MVKGKERIMDEKEKGPEPEFRVKLVNELTDKIENILFETMTKNKMSIWETESVFLRLRFDIDEYKHTILHLNGGNTPEFKGTSSIYK